MELYICVYVTIVYCTIFFQLVSSLAAKANYASPDQVIPSDRKKRLTREESYTSPPPPRPVPRTSLSDYDPVPSPRQITTYADQQGMGELEAILPEGYASSEIDDVIESGDDLRQHSTCTSSPSPPPLPTISTNVSGGDTVSEFPPPPSPTSLENFATAASASMAVVPYTSSTELVPVTQKSNASDFSYLWMHGSTESNNGGEIKEGKLY